MNQYTVDRVVNADETLDHARITVGNGLIQEVESGNASPVETELQAAYAIPGFIDIHTHGALGLDTMDARAESLKTIATYHLGTGTTSFLCSTLTAPLADIRKALICISD